MNSDRNGTWYLELQGNQDGLIYNYNVKNYGVWAVAVDPYAKAVTVNGEKSVVVDLSTTNPPNWKPISSIDRIDISSIVLYELSVRDLSSKDNSGIINKGKFLGLTELNTKYSGNIDTGLAHIKTLGITHIQLMPIFDFVTVDEKNPKAQYNWGYDPHNYNCVDGSYCTDPLNPKNRIIELKLAIQAIHNQGLYTVMDVVYNHTYHTDNSNLEKITPGYFYRINRNGTWANESGCGNVLASEHPMVRKFIIDSVCYWAKEFNFDGFRFDLMGLTDKTTINQVRKALDALCPKLFIHGEGWNMGYTLKGEDKSAQYNASNMPGIGFFNDNMRDLIKGSAFDRYSPGFINGDSSQSYNIRKGIVGATHYNDSISSWGYEVKPQQCTNYVEAHDNHTLWDKLCMTNHYDTVEDRKKMHLLAAALVLTSQGIPFIQAGQEFLRSKKGEENSYNLSDEINGIDWASKEENMDIYWYFKGLISLRKSHPAFRMTSSEMIRKHLSFIDTYHTAIAYTLSGYANNDIWRDIVVAFNAERNPHTIKLPRFTTWKVVVEGISAGTSVIYTLQDQYIKIPPLSTVVLYAD